MYVSTGRPVVYNKLCALLDGTCQTLEWLCYQFSSFKLKNLAHTRVCVDILQVTSVIERSSIGKMEELENCPCLNELHQALRWSVVRWLGGLSCIFLSADSDECLIEIIRYEFCRLFHRTCSFYNQHIFIFSGHKNGIIWQAKNELGWLKNE